MIQGLEYEPPPDDPSYYGSPSSQSVTSVNLLSPSHSSQQYHQAQQSYRSPNYNDQSLHRRRPRNGHDDRGHGAGPNDSAPAEEDKYARRRGASRLARKLDIFPKTERDYTVRTERGGQLTAVGYAMMTLLILAEWTTYRGMNRESLEHIVVDTSIGKRMRVNLNITFPAIHCEDVHLDVMDVAGDSHIGLDEEMVKRRLNIRDGKPLNRDLIRAEANVKADEDRKRRDALKMELPEDYCGPCYGAKAINESGCCETCDDVLEAYRKMRWNDQAVQPLAEQCIREGRGSNKPRNLLGGEGCNLSGHFTVNRVGGNFHVAMGEGVDRDGRHVHNFLPEDRINFNATHVIHELSFMDAEYGNIGVGGMKEDTTEKVGINGERSLNGVTKVVTEGTGTTGLFQYFIKVVPTRYRGDIIDDMGVTTTVPGGLSGERRVLETNRYFYTERFRPLIGEVHEEAMLGGNADHGTASMHVGGKSGGTLHEKVGHHDSTNAVLPGIFFVYEIYPFAVEVTKNRVPFMHLLTRIMATVGGVFTIMSLIDGALYSREKKSRR